jgi:beta-aspartyl-peptidase (threonine type)
MIRISAITGVLLFATLLSTQTTAARAKRANSTTAEMAIQAELDQQVAAWNRGDLKGYMQGYWHSPELTFFAGSHESAGWEPAYQRYRAAYLGKDKEMGHLTFIHVRITELGPEAGLVRGGWQLTMKDGSKRSGLFTVVLKKVNAGWRIIHDHSS